MSRVLHNALLSGLVWTLTGSFDSCFYAPRFLQSRRLKSVDWLSDFGRSSLTWELGRNSKAWTPACLSEPGAPCPLVVLQGPLARWPQGMRCTLSSHSRAHTSRGPSLVMLILTRGPGGDRLNPLTSSLTCSHAFVQSSPGNSSPSSSPFPLLLQLLFDPLSPSLEQRKGKQIMLIVVWLITTKK